MIANNYITHLNSRRGRQRRLKAWAASALTVVAVLAVYQAVWGV